MAKAVKEIPNIPEYPWDVWLKVGSKWKLTQGEDFEVSPKSMACQCHTAAKRNKVGIRVRIRLDEKAVYLEVYNPADAKKKATKASPKKVAKVATKKAAPKKAAKKVSKPVVSTKEPVTNG